MKVWNEKKKQSQKEKTIDCRSSTHRKIETYIYLEKNYTWNLEHIRRFVKKQSINKMKWNWWEKQFHSKWVLAPMEIVEQFFAQNDRFNFLSIIVSLRKCALQISFSTEIKFKKKGKKNKNRIAKWRYLSLWFKTKWMKRKQI